MNRKRLFKNLAYSIILLSLVNFLAVKLYWYFSIKWFDMPMHFWGGFCAGLLLIWLFSLKNLFSSFSLSLVVKIFIGVLIIGTLWEVFEIVFNNIIAEIPFDLLDTLSDLFFDLAGGALAIFYLYFSFTEKISPNQGNKV